MVLCQANSISNFKGVFPCLVTWQESACPMAQTFFLGKNTSESFPANSLLLHDLFRLGQCRLLLPIALQLQNSCPAAAATKTSGRLLWPAVPQLNITRLRKSSGRGGPVQIGAAQRGPASARSPTNPQRWTRIVSAAHADSGRCPRCRAPAFPPPHTNAPEILSPPPAAKTPRDPFPARPSPRCHLRTERG